MRRQFIAGSFALALLASSLPVSDAQAGWKEKWGAFWQRCKVDYQRNVAWPEPFQTQDREAIRMPWVVMMDNGWRMHNTLPGELFVEPTQELTYAGRLRLEDIVTNSPLHRRTVFVLRGETPEITAARVASVQRTLDKMLPEGSRPDVLLTDVGPRAGSGDYYDRVNREVDRTVPAPRLPEFQGPGSEK